MLLSQHKKANMFRAKRLIVKGGTRNLNRCSYQLSRQFLITASTFPYSSKNSSAEHIHILRTCLTLTNTLTHMTNTHSHIDLFTHTHSHTHTHTHTHIYAHRDIYKKRQYVRLMNFWSCMER